MLGDSGIIQDDDSSSKRLGSADHHDYVVKKTLSHMLHELCEEPQIPWSSSSEQSSSKTAFSSARQGGRRAFAAKGSETSSSFAAAITGEPPGDGNSHAFGRSSSGSGRGGGRGGSSVGGGGSRGSGRGRGHGRGQAQETPRTNLPEASADGMCSSQAWGSEGGASPGPHGSRPEWCPNTRLGLQCHDPQQQTTHWSPRPCKGRREQYDKLLQETMRQITDNPDGFDVDTFELPLNMSNNACFKDKFMQRIREHQEWVKCGGPNTGGVSTAEWGPSQFAAKNKVLTPGLVSAQLAPLPCVIAPPPLPGYPEVCLRFSV